MKIEIHEHAYHRNGVSGLGFTLVSFSLFAVGAQSGFDEGSDDEIEEWELLGIITNNEKDDVNLGTDNAVEIFIISPDDVNLKWRGDQIGEALIKELELAGI